MYYTFEQFKQLEVNKDLPLNEINRKFIYQSDLKYRMGYYSGRINSDLYVDKGYVDEGYVDDYIE